MRRGRKDWFSLGFNLWNDQVNLSHNPPKGVKSIYKDKECTTR
jgi:hypothetical protein